MVNFFLVWVLYFRDLFLEIELYIPAPASPLWQVIKCVQVWACQNTRLVIVLCVRACNLIVQWEGKWKLSIPGVQPRLFPLLSLFWAQKRHAMHHGRCILEGMDKANGELAIVHSGTFVSVLRPLCGLTRTNWLHNNGWIMDVNKSFCS